MFHPVHTLDTIAVLLLFTVPVLLNLTPCSRALPVKAQCSSSTLSLVVWLETSVSGLSVDPWVTYA